MSARDKIVTAVRSDVDGFRSEVVTVPEWADEQVRVREASAADKRAWRARSRKFVEVVGGYDVVPVDDTLGDIFLVVRCTYELDGSTRVFNDDDLDMLAQGGESTDAAVRRLYEAALRVSGFADDSDAEGNDPEGSEATTV